MTPTNKLRFVERQVQMHPFYKGADGSSPSYQYYRVLQQWWQDSLQHDILTDSFKGEWRDVLLEKE